MLLPTTQRIHQARYQYIQLIRIAGASVDIAIRPHNDSADLTRSDPIGKYPVGFDEVEMHASRGAFPGTSVTTRSPPSCCQPTVKLPTSTILPRASL
jgi:hypothetical protein